MAASNGQLAAARAKIDPEKRRETCRQTALKLAAEGRGLGAIVASKWIDPDHPELGELNPGYLVRLQKKLGLPHGKENRIRVG
jgi:hypothetical protein